MLYVFPITFEVVYEADTEAEAVEIHQRHRIRLLNLALKNDLLWDDGVRREYWAVE